jgi:hypothetical protein
MRFNWNYRRWTTAQRLRRRGYTYGAIAEALGCEEKQVANKFHTDRGQYRPEYISRRSVTGMGTKDLHSKRAVVVSAQALAERERAYSQRQSITATLMGDPPPGRSALERRA